MKIIHILTILIGAVFLIWFSIKLFTHRILNIGNLTGLVVSGILLLGGIFYKNFQQGIFYLQKNFLGKCVIGIVIAVVSVVVITAIIETVFIVKASIKKPKENATLIVLGCKVYGEHASRSLRERLDAALIYLEENPDSQCIVSGGMGEGEKISEAECMYRYLIKKGIHSSRIIKIIAGTHFFYLSGKIRILSTRNLVFINLRIWRIHITLKWLINLTFMFVIII